MISVPLPDCSLNEDNFSLRCPKHKVKKERVFYVPFLGNCDKNFKFSFSLSRLLKIVVGFKSNFSLLVLFFLVSGTQFEVD